MVNRLFQNIVWGQRSNYLEIPTDCPQRDERLGWAGDAQAFIGTAAYNMDVAAFFTAWLRSYDDCQGADGGIPNFVPDRTAGATRPAGRCRGHLPLDNLPRLRRSAHSPRALRDHDPVDRLAGEAQQGRPAAPKGGWGDWLNVRDNTPTDVIATAYFAYSTSLMVRVANALGKDDDAARFQKLLKKIKAAFNRAYVAEDGRIKGHTQTTYLMALGFDLVPEGKRPLALKHLLKLIEGRQQHLSTGFLGVNLLAAGARPGRPRRSCLPPLAKRHLSLLGL